MAHKSALDSVRYIFQVPLAWYKKVDEWLFGVHPGYMVSFGEDPDNAPTIGIDKELFEQEVARVAGGGSSYSDGISVVTGVTWNGTQIVVAHKTINVTNGVITGVTDAANTTIATTTYSAS